MIASASPLIPAVLSLPGMSCASCRDEERSLVARIVGFKYLRGYLNDAAPLAAALAVIIASAEGNIGL